VKLILEAIACPKTHPHAILNHNYCFKSDESSETSDLASTENDCKGEAKKCSAKYCKSNNNLGTICNIIKTINIS